MAGCRLQLGLRLWHQLQVKVSMSGIITYAHDLVFVFLFTCTYAFTQLNDLYPYM